MKLINGTTASDRIRGTTGDDLIYAQAGNDFVYGSLGADTILGGSGFDTVDYQASNAGISIRLGYTEGGAAYTFEGRGGYAQGDRLLDVEAVIGSAFSDTIIGNNLDNSLSGAAGNDRLYGMGGNDRLEGGLGSDTLDGGAGIDTLVLDNVNGAGVSASLFDGGNIFYANGDVDTIYRFENLIGSNGSDRIFGSDTDNELQGGSGNDVIFAGGGNDRLIGGADNDDLSGGLGEDILSGGDGNDILRGGAGADFNYGGSGIDTISYSDSNASVAVNLVTRSASGGFANGDSFLGIEAVEGSHYNDRLTGDSGANTLSGLGGSDFIDGGAGDDFIDGGSGDDRLIGGAGVDAFFFDLVPVQQFGDDAVPGGSANIGNDVIAGWESGIDTLLWRHNFGGAQGLADAMNISRVSFEGQISTRITFDGVSGSVTLLGIDPNTDPINIG